MNLDSPNYLPVKAYIENDYISLQLHRCVQGQSAQALSHEELRRCYSALSAWQLCVQCPIFNVFNFSRALWIR